MAGNNSELEKRLWTAADQLRANSRLKATEYSVPVLGLIFLRYADVRFAKAKAEIESQGTSGRRAITEANYHAKGVVYLPEEARFGNLINLPEGANLGKVINDAMKAIEDKNPDLKDVLPKSYNRLENSVLVELLKIFNSVPMDIEGDAFGRIYEYFLGNFALSEGQRGGEFFTATSIVKLIVEIIEPYHGYIFDPACGSGGMFVQSAAFVARHQGRNSDISVYGQERVAETVRLCRMNLAVHGLHGDIRQSNSYYEDPHNLAGKFDFLMANPPFNVNGIDKEKLKDDKARFPFGMPRADNGNYIWIQLFYSALKKTGRAGFVMANSASDARQSEGEIRKALIQDGAVDVMVAVGSNFFYNVTLPVTLWFLDKGKKGTPREDKVLFLDARNSSYLNRMLSPDDIVPDPYNPLDWDRYSYTRNNPIRYADPTGHAVACGTDAGNGCDGGSVDDTIVFYLNGLGGHDPDPTVLGTQRDEYNAFYYALRRSVGSENIVNVPLFKPYDKINSHIQMAEEAWGSGKPQTNQVVDLIEDFVSKNPGKRLVIVGSSAGGTVAVESLDILKERGIYVDQVILRGSFVSEPVLQNVGRVDYIAADPPISDRWYSFDVNPFDSVQVQQHIVNGFSGHVPSNPLIMQKIIDTVYQAFYAARK